VCGVFHAKLTKKHGIIIFRPKFLAGNMVRGGNELEKSFPIPYRQKCNEFSSFRLPLKKILFSWDTLFLVFAFIF